MTLSYSSKHFLETTQYSCNFSIIYVFLFVFAIFCQLFEYNSDWFLFSWAPKSLQTVTAVTKLKDTWKKSYDKSRGCIKKQGHHFVDKSPYKAMVFPAVMDRCESWIIKKAEHQRTDPFEL